MDVNKRVLFIKKVKFFLIFFCLLLFINCQKKFGIEKIKVNYNNNKAESISFIFDQDLNDFKIYLKENQQTNVLGNLISEHNKYSFIPTIPFTDGQQYVITNKNEVVDSFIIQNSTNIKAPELVAIYPTKDTVPENLLKMYLVFSKPMQEVKSALDYIEVTDESTNKKVNIFLPLENELWNKNHTQLTLWLDPGRIKTGLIPNKKLGLPILNSHQYTINVSKDWKSADGVPLKNSFKKTMYAILHDNQIPMYNNWKISTPKSNTPEPLIINFNETLDFVLAMESFQILNLDKEVVEGKFKLVNHETVLEFYPKFKWNKGEFRIMTDTRLEDLAGNNLNHLFDKDLDKDYSINDSSKTKSIHFSIH
jgi:hypothetical protein